MCIRDSFAAVPAGGNYSIPPDQDRSHGHLSAGIGFPGLRQDHLHINSIAVFMIAAHIVIIDRFGLGTKQ